MKGTRTTSNRRLLTAGLATLLLFTLIGSTPGAFAATNLVIGGSAVISGANGDAVRLREAPGSGSAILGEFSEGTPVFVVDGPITAGDGSPWYLVAVEGLSGFIAADFLSLNGDGAPRPPAEPEGDFADDFVDEPSGDDAAVTESEELLVVSRVITGQGTIVNTNGDPIRCRANASTSSSILALLYEGNTVGLQGNAVGSWQPVRCAGSDGWVYTDFIAVTSNPPVAPADESGSGTGTITGTNGDGANCRSKASSSGGVITVLAEGTSVTIRGAKSGDWQPVTCANRDGFVWAAFVSVAPSGGGSDSGSGSGNGVIYNTNGDGVRCRDKGSLASNVITVLVEGNTVALRGAVSGDWQPVTCSGKKGFVHKDYIKAASSDDGGSGVDNGSGGGGIAFGPGDTVQVSGTNGTGVRLRSARSATSSVITIVAETELLTVRTGSKDPWIAVVYRGSNGFIHKDYLAAAAANDPVDPVPTDGLSNGDHGKVTDRVNFRGGASYTAGVLDVAPAGAIVLVTGGISNGFYPVNWGGLDGFIHGDYLVWTDEPLSGADPGGVGGGSAGNGSSNATGDAMVAYAMDYLGYPYIWATAGPNSFDCSGFTYWVTKHVIGDDIGRGLWTQIVAGPSISYGNLQPGDLVFFQNTYTWGLSHVGIYIGNNQFIHAENEDTGVRISSLTSNYYSTRYYGAVRLS